MAAAVKPGLISGRLTNAASGWYFGLSLISALAVLGGMAAPATAQSQRQRADTSEKVIEFDIPAQSISKSLYAFSAATGIEILLDARHAEGRQAARVKGAMTPGDALAMLLAGSGLVAREFGPDTVILTTATRPPLGGVFGASSGADPPYFADIQRAVQQVLCSDAKTAPGRYRLALKLWIGQSGTVLRSQRLDTTGDKTLDAALDAAVQSTRIGRPPPPDLPQPVTLVVSPAKAFDLTVCSDGVPGLRAASARQQ